jgi:hypothetical protein
MSKCTVAWINVVPAFLSYSDLIDPIVQLGVLVARVYVRAIVVDQSRVPCRYAMRYCAAVVRRACVLKVSRVVYYGFTALWRTPSPTARSSANSPLNLAGP